MKIKELKNALSPKTILLDAIKSKLEGSGVAKITGVFNLAEDRYNVMLSNIKSENIHLDIEQSEINMIKKLFVNKILLQYKKDHKHPIKSVILQIDLQEYLIEIFIEDQNKNVTRYDYGT
jgi:hypothetical protein